MSTEAPTPAERIGIVLPEVYDGISVWQEPDGTYTNRWDSAQDWRPWNESDARILTRRRTMAQDWIDQQNGAQE